MYFPPQGTIARVSSPFLGDCRQCSSLANPVTFIALQINCKQSQVRLSRHPINSHAIAKPVARKVRVDELSGVGDQFVALVHLSKIRH